ncbi:MAG TPA: hypothetical protein VGZ47_21535 [Gemmataceae bacterium]|jgi:hypothetical protein|nr:hypothetical protein [Gemmataceae bacterium]
MPDTSKQSPADCPAETDAISMAVNRAARQAAIENALLGYSVPYWINGQVVWVPPDEILAKFEYKKSDQDQLKTHRNGT